MDERQARPKALRRSIELRWEKRRRRDQEMESNEESARDWDKRIEEGTELDDLEPIEAKASGRESRSMVFSVRLSPEEMQEISAAAGDRKLGDFMRTAALAAARVRSSDQVEAAIKRLVAAQALLEATIAGMSGNATARRRSRRPAPERNQTRAGAA